MKIKFNDNWFCYRTGEQGTAFAVSLPHDAMQLDKRSETGAGGVSNGWIEAQDYTYEKKFPVSEKDRGKNIFFEFEGVYRKATVYVNEKKAAFHDYGYIGFYVDAAKLLNYGGENTIRVETINHDQPNSRWYSGTGIYRPVWMHVLPREHILLDSVRVTTLDYQKPEVRIEAETTAPGRVSVELMDGSDMIAVRAGESAETVASKERQEAYRFSCEINLDSIKLWQPENPKLYICRVSFGQDIQEVTFGVRTVECTPEKGFLINGQRVILKGACIHHDNGILGARAFDFSERRKIRILKENGYNAIRSAHNPCSKTFLDACDELGMLVMDEYIDGWYIHKTKYDYATKIFKNYRQDLKDMVDKDYNHPSVILYSTGNEVSETAQKKGIALCEDMTERLHELDATRPVSCGINIFFNFLSTMGFGVYSDKKANAQVKDGKKKKAVGSEFFNTIAGIFGANFMKFGATLYPCDLKTRDAFAKMDVAGYNYGIKRYRHDLKKYPKRMILGSETFCADVFRFMEEVKRDKRIIGDFVWAGMDYLGEVGIGAWEYGDYASRFDGGCGWVSAGSGRIDLTGKPLAEMSYIRVVFEQQAIGVGVVPVNHTKEKHSSSAWKMSNTVESWSWNGCEGMMARVEVYARASLVKLFVNGVCVGEKRPINDCRVLFDTPYHDGELKAVAYDEGGKALAEKILRTAGAETLLTLEPEQESLKKDADLCYVRLKYTDTIGETKPLARGEISISVENGQLLAAGSACPYYPDSYLTDKTDTYFGEALAIIKPAAAGMMVVKASSKYGEATAGIRVEE